MRLLIDAPPGSGPVLSTVRSIVRANHRIAPLDALQLSTASFAAAAREGVDGNFIAATLLQESAFDPRAMSAAGAVGIAQFTIPTARAHGVDPFDPDDAIPGGARVLASYLARYAHERGDRYALTLAAYNAGPGAVSLYHGVPPYAETREYIGDIYERWARLIRER
ncbi:MAG: hypothetical protein NVSMB64_04420 [Candidatus Velthaea sp.]